MPALPLETALIAALIGFVGAIAGQVFGAFLGTRHAARVQRETALEVARLNAEAQEALARQRYEWEWRERLVRPLLDLAAGRLRVLADYSEAVSNLDVATARRHLGVLQRTEGLLHAHSWEALGDLQLAAAGMNWVAAEEKAIAMMDKILEGRGFPALPDFTLGELSDLLDATVQLHKAAERFIFARGQAQSSASGSNTRTPHKGALCRTLAVERPTSSLHG
jgi:hypothetical protein